MTQLLQINTSLFAGQGQSSQLAEQFVAEWRAHHPDSRVTVRDLARDGVPHLDAGRFSAFTTAPEARNPEQQAVIAYSDALINELKAADVIVLGLPLYNFGVPSQLKAYFDHVARNGVSFRYTANGPEGLIKGKKAYVFAARGGLYAGTPLDTQTNYVRDFLRFIGIEDVEFVYAEGLNISAELKATALTKAQDEIHRLAA
ncbi:MAG: NAD(P)H-dependent oxidoreductase [Stagnimonas sp.]|nr:NAD(P)H-dependent oxidoreductase [Stagnimonas sp.]